MVTLTTVNLATMTMGEAFVMRSIMRNAIKKAEISAQTQRIQIDDESLLEFFK